MVERRRITLNVSRSASTAVLASQLPIYDDYGHRLWLITDPSEMDWERDWRYLDQTVNEVAQTVRLPLMAAGSLIKRAERALDEEFGVRTMLDAALRQIGKADITYERLSNTLTVRNGPDRQPELLDVVQALRQAIAALPEEDIDACDRGALDISKAPFRVVGWPEQLGFAFRSVLGYLLVRRPLSGKVRIEVLQEDGSGLCLRFSVCGARPESPIPVEADDWIAAGRERAQEIAALNAGAIGVAVRRHGGTFTIHDHDDGTVTTSILFRATDLRTEVHVP